MTPIEPAAPGTPEPSAVAVGATAGSRLVRATYAVIGTVALAFGVAGLVLPVLPTTPFLLLAAACYARASQRLYTWLLGRRALGPIITEWRRSRSLPPRVKSRALVAVAATFSVSILIVDEVLLRGALAATGVVLAVFLGRIPTRL
jgi:uncharacterized protein